MVSVRNPLAQRSKVTLEEVASQPLIFRAPATLARFSISSSSLPLARACRHGIAQHRHDQTICRRGRRVSFISESFARDR